MRRTTLHAGINVVLVVFLAAASFYLGWHSGADSNRKVPNLRYVSQPSTRPTTALLIKSPRRNSTSKEHLQTVKPTSSQSRETPRPWVILATTNQAFLDFTENWLESLKRSNITDHVTIIAEDNATRQALANRKDIKLEILLTDNANLPSKFLSFGSRDYIRLVNKRPSYILSYLEKGVDVLFSDVDTVWLKNPLSFFTGDYDLYIGRDIYDNPKAPDVACAGFVYYSATNATIDLLLKWIRSIHDRPGVPDQELLNHWLRNHATRQTLNVKYLDQRQFPNGNDYFNAKWRMKNADVEPIVVHNNWIKGHDVKIKRFKNVSLWYL
ncbi:UDP-D-xylose:L-fucose alpha-1,3-D-xylosyltransferase 3-like [Lytechinus variegatus]|uniref:UDP-D-xylose:L-fucose alpha-1,3-D-xylosyltransferase 3-like n=1 Tax=Lytechinus variegatus TaxID=7654 RepID=UPI001BB1F4D3|nr:UDP-D-xylose:L-fucose alpha-1,3-D-xylosyltransferase 3-like [Lytechinus variegatus]XP_041479268.1 UDP-D-xylose:L-fucose alpha-1,3-D-xylosyltransferase 3-like [Lytechinus variegatus]